MLLKISGDMYRQLLVKLFGAAYAGVYRYLAFSSGDEKRMFSVLLKDCGVLNQDERKLFFRSYGISETGEPTIIPSSDQELMLNQIHSKLLKSNFVSLFKEFASSSDHKTSLGRSPEAVSEIVVKVDGVYYVETR